MCEKFTGVTGMISSSGKYLIPVNRSVKWHQTSILLPDAMSGPSHPPWAYM